MTIQNSSTAKFLITTIISIQSFLIGQIQPALALDKYQIIAGLKNPNWKERSQVLKSIPMTLLPDPEISEALIELLRFENDYYWTIIRGPAE
ncbi:MAG: hypothetical protein ACE5GN_05810, partial [Waddliaceae bacterium]